MGHIFAIIFLIHFTEPGLREAALIALIESPYGDKIGRGRQ